MLMRFCFLVLIAILSGCANFNTISRTSSLGGVSNTQNTAIHLDAQQRVVLSKKDMEKVCAEPNPDAMAAYVAALGIGVQVPRLGGGSGAGGQQTSVADIGLRTQSITLMRDVLYRICEASMNNMVGPVYNATLLGRGMDLTAIVLSVEQLTGAVKAKQAILQGSTDASAAANLVQDFRALEQAIASRNKHQIALNDANKKLSEKEKAIEEQQVAYEAIKKQREEEQKNAGSVKPETEQKFQDEDKKLKQLKTEKEQLDKEATSEQELIQAAEKDIEDIKKLKGAASTGIDTNASAKTTTTGQFDSSSERKSLHDNNQINIDKIAGVVESIVKHALDKEYKTDACLAIIGLPNVTAEEKVMCNRILEIENTNADTRNKNAANERENSV